jgi:hypothetical protein
MLAGARRRRSSRKAPTPRSYCFSCEHSIVSPPRVKWVRPPGIDVAADELLLLGFAALDVGCCRDL